MKPALAASALAAFFVAALAPQCAAAQTIYRCGNEYSRMPCAAGRALDVGDPRSAAQRDEAHAIAAQQRQQGRAMEHERRHAEAMFKPALAVAVGPAPPAPAASAPKKATRKKTHRKVQVADDRDFIAGVPRNPKKPTATP
jgi:hypothetical protein